MLLVLVMAGLAGCRLIGPGTGGDGSPWPDPRVIAHPPGDNLVLRLADRGGFVPAEYQLTRLPAFSLLGDGRVIVAGAIPAIYPGPILPPLLERRLTEDGIQLVLRAALDSGALDASADWRGAANYVADASDSVFTLHAGGRGVVVSVYALGIGSAGDETMSNEERRAHEALGELSSLLTTLDTWLPADAWMDGRWHAYRADSLRLLTRNADEDADVADGLELRVAAWPLPGDPAGFGASTSLDGWRCGVVSGKDAVTWYAELGGADQLTRWSAAGHRYAVAARPLLPNDVEGCDPAA
jgi:hypothetical protein